MTVNLVYWNHGIKYWNILLGVAFLIDSLIRIFSFGFLSTCLPLVASHYQTRAELRKRGYNVSE
jgi:hypothetical protein